MRYILKIKERYKYRIDECTKYETDESSASLLLKCTIDQYIYGSDTFRKFKNAKNIESMNVLNTRPMKVALHYF
jgi:hypothetical protein